ncbi:reverse transcriptase domain-containing protein [Tanacetum coccineum]|uniref:Reverse transcriptase domain-containing protein n=1 Tax=Tanacetum coccineum TaxID=301880 RepID=A0ABQ5H645_9ASTR
MPPKRTTTPMTDATIKALIAQGVATTLAEYQWFEKMESIFHISNCTTVSHEVAYRMTCKTLKKMMTNKYCPRGKIKKLEIEVWNPKVKGTDVRTLTCYECGNQGHYRSDCSKLKNQNQGNQAGGTEARGMMYALGGGEIDQDLDNMEDDINA